jgi:hypothetical protein
VLLVVRLHLGRREVRHLGRQVRDQPLAAHLVALLDDRDPRFIADRGRDLVRRHFDPVRGRVLGDDDLLDELVEHGARHFGRELREVGAGVPVEVPLEVRQREHPVVHPCDHVRRNARLPLTGGQHGQRKQQKDCDAAGEHGRKRV